MPDITKLKVDPVAAVACLFGAAVIIPSLIVLMITLFSVACVILG